MKNSNCLLRFFCLLLLFAVSFEGMAQRKQKVNKLDRRFDEATILYHQQNYSKALQVVDELLTADSTMAKAYLLKADIFHDQKKIAEEAVSLKRALSIDSIGFPRAYFLLGMAHQKLGEYALARNSFQSFIKHGTGSDSQLKTTMHKIDECDFALHLMSHPVPYNPVLLSDSVNTEEDEYWPSLSIDGKILVFTRLVNFRDSVTGREFKQEDFYEARNEGGSWKKASPVSSLNTLNNEGAQSISPDASLLFFTACSRRDTWGGCDLYYSKIINGKWGAIRNAGQPVNSTLWEAQPSVSANNEYLYFVSNRKGGKGGMDIWRCRMLESDGEVIRWGKAENLGDSINTSGNEMSPFIHPDGKTLYFGSDGWPGMGGVDLFVSTARSDSSWSKPKNLGFPINTHFDEKGMVVDASGRQAYYSSNRNGQSLDFVVFELPEQVKPLPVTYAQGKVRDADSQLPIHASIELVDLEKSDQTIRLETNQNGEFMFGLPLQHRYLLNVSASAYLFYSRHFALDTLLSAGKPFLFDVDLQPVKSGAAVVMHNVFFETDSYELKAESGIELGNLIDLLQLNPSIKIEIGGHTDKVGSESYNLELSKKRAEQVYNYLVSKGIDAKRLRFNGYGFSKPVADNETASGRAANRRTEFVVID